MLRALVEVSSELCEAFTITVKNGFCLHLVRGFWVEPSYPLHWGLGEVSGRAQKYRVAMKRHPNLPKSVSR